MTDEPPSRAQPFSRHHTDWLIFRLNGPLYQLKQLIVARRDTIAEIEGQKSAKFPTSPVLKSVLGPDYQSYRNIIAVYTSLKTLSPDNLHFLGDCLDKITKAYDLESGQPHQEGYQPIPPDRLPIFRRLYANFERDRLKFASNF